MASSPRKGETFDSTSGMSECSQAATIVTWSESVNEDDWLDKGSAMRIRSAFTRRKSEDSLEFETDGVVRSQGFVRPVVKDARNSFVLQRPAMPKSTISSGSPQSSPRSSSSPKTSKSGSWIMRVFRKMTQEKHRTARLDSSNLQGRGICIDSTSVDLF